MRLTRTTAAAVLAGLVLAGCSGREQASETLPTPSTTSLSASPTLPPLGPPDLPMPAGARVHSVDGAKRFVNYYINLINRAQGDLETDSLIAFTYDCETCNKLLEGFNSFHARGYAYRGGLISILGVNIDQSRENAPFTISLRQDSVEVFNNAGEPLPEYSAPPLTYPASGGSLRWDANQLTWLMTELTIA